MHASWEGKPCPKCAYVRLPADTNPAWQCPRCHIAYAKYRPRAMPLAARLAEDGREMAAEAKSDDSLLALLAANLFALAIAYHTHMSLRDVILVYWIQSVVIGVTNVLRILNLDRFDTTDLTIKDEQVPATPASKRIAALVFLMHFGLFHAVYLEIVVIEGQGDIGTPGAYFFCALVFAVNHGYSLLRNMQRDAAGRPSLRALVFLPYARILPMHAIAFLGGTVTGSTYMFFLFGALKIVADLVMHTVEHHVLSKGKSLPFSIGA